MERMEATTHRHVTPVTVCQAIHNVPYHAAGWLIRAVRSVGRCFAWTWDAVVCECRRDALALRRWFFRSAPVRAWRALRRSPTLNGFADALRANPLVRLMTMIAVTALVFVGAVSYDPPRTVDAICIVVDGDGPHVLDQRSETRDYRDLLLRRSVGDNALQLVLQPGRTVTVNHAGQVNTYTTRAERLGAFLHRTGIALGEDEMVELNTTGDQLALHISHTLTYQHYVVVETDYQVRRIADPLMDKGTEQVLRKGVKGQVVETYEDTVVSGEVVSTRYRGASHDTSHAEIVLYGTRVYEVARDDTIAEDHPNENGEGGYLLFKSGDTMTYSKAMLCNSTAYYSGGEHGAAWTTAVGASVGLGTIAVDPKVIPYYTNMFIQTPTGSRVYGMGTALDCGGAIKGNIVDLWFPTYADCARWGRRNVTVYILDKKA